jgi:hypothetical protein
MVPAGQTTFNPESYVQQISISTCYGYNACAWLFLRKLDMAGDKVNSS